MYAKSSFSNFSICPAFYFKKVIPLVSKGYYEEGIATSINSLHDNNQQFRCSNDTEKREKSRQIMSWLGGNFWFFLLQKAIIITGSDIQVKHQHELLPSFLCLHQSVSRHTQHCNIIFHDIKLPFFRFLTENWYWRSDLEAWDGRKIWFLIFTNRSTWLGSKKG